MSKGITLDKEEIIKLKEILNSIDFDNVLNEELTNDSKNNAGGLDSIFD